MNINLNHLKIFGLSCLFLLAPGLGGCMSKPVYNVESEPVISTGGSHPMPQIKKAIFQAAVSLGWRPREIKPGQIEATLHLRDHMAKVDIFYNTRTYSIKYKDSSNLDYDGTNIHRNYNNWIINLRNHINSNLVAAS